MSDRISVTRNGGVADVKLNRPDKLNALDLGMFDALIETSEELAADRSLRCVVLSGEGRSFCAGLDFAAFAAGITSGERSQPDEDPGATPEGLASLTHVAKGSITHRAQQAVYGWTSLPVPVIAALHGHVFGGGIQLALGADIRLVAADAKLSVLEIRWGLIPDMTGTQTLVDLVGLDVAKELTYTGRTFSGIEAADLGICTRVVDEPHSEAMGLALEIASKSPEAIRAAKRLFNAAPRSTTSTGFANERDEIGRLLGSPNQIEQIQAFFEQRDPVFVDPAD